MKRSGLISNRLQRKLVSIPYAPTNQPASQAATKPEDLQGNSVDLLSGSVQQQQLHANSYDPESHLLHT